MNELLGGVNGKNKRSLSICNKETIIVGKKPVIYKAAEAYQTTCRMTRQQNKKFRNAMAREGYSVKKKSLWVSEAIHDFFSDAKWMDALSCFSDDKGKDEPEKFNLDPGLKPLLDEGERILQEAGFKGSCTSKLIRHAINMRILRRRRYDASLKES